MCTDKLAYKSGMAGEFSGDSEWRVVVAGELLFVFGFIFASIIVRHGNMVWPLRILLVNKLILRDRTCSDRGFYSLDFISHPEECNGENDSGC